MTIEPNESVLDASALLALINREPGAERVLQALPSSCISAVNLCEVAGKLVDRGVPVDDVDSHLAALEIEVIDFDRAAAVAAGALCLVVPHTLSLGDRACISLGLTRGVAVMTADSQWSKVGPRGLRIIAIR
jgi:PIN domain nuclease of toxin-antitoxin system